MLPVFTLIPAGAVWKYLDNGSDQGMAWKESNFDDHTWAAGPARLGYGEDGEVTTLSFGPDENNKYITTYFRREFTIGNPASVPGLLMRLLRDDGAVVYLNGTEVFRSNLPDGPINYLTGAPNFVADGEEQVFFETCLDPSLLVAGKNVLAVEIHQYDGLSSDIGFDLELDVLGAQPPVITISPQAQTAACASDVSFSVAATGTGPLAYQWRHDGVPIIDATSSTLHLVAVGLAATGNYSVEVTNPYGTASATAVLTVRDTTAPVAVAA